MASNKQINYAEILFNDLGIDTPTKKKDYLQLRFKKDHISDLSNYECFRLITALKDKKDNLKLKFSEEI